MRHDAPDLPRGQFLGLALDAGEENEQVVLEVLETARRERDAMDREVAHPAELDHVKSADRGERLVLAADRFLEHVPLEVDRLVGKVQPWNQPAAKRIERIEQTDHERRRRTQSRKRRQLRGVVDLDVLSHTRPPQAFAERGVLELFDRRRRTRPCGRRSGSSSRTSCCRTATY